MNVRQSRSSSGLETHVIYVTRACLNKRFTFEAIQLSVVDTDSIASRPGLERDRFGYASYAVLGRYYSRLKLRGYMLLQCLSPKRPRILCFGGRRIRLTDCPMSRADHNQIGELLVSQKLQRRRLQGFCDHPAFTSKEEEKRSQAG